MSVSLEERKRGRLAALFAFSNMGLGHHITPHNSTLSSSWTGNAEYDIVSIASSFIENEKMEEDFILEARSWSKTLSTYSFERIQEIWPHHEWVKDIINAKEK